MSGLVFRRAFGSLLPTTFFPVLFESWKGLAANIPKTNWLLQIYNVEKDPIDLTPPWLSPSNLDTTRQLELELDDLEGPLLLYLMKP